MYDLSELFTLFQKAPVWLKIRVLVSIKVCGKSRYQRYLLLFWCSKERYRCLKHDCYFNHYVGMTISNMNHELLRVYFVITIGKWIDFDAQNSRCQVWTVEKIKIMRNPRKLSKNPEQGSRACYSVKISAPSSFWARRNPNLKKW